MIQEVGFWDYTCPGNGSLEQYTHDDWELLLDDMAAGGMNSFVLCVKWLTTGYRSRLPWLDQQPGVTAIDSDNALIHQALRGARSRGMRPWLLVVGTQYDIPSFGIEPANPHARWGDIGNYDLDQPEIAERVLALFAEVISLFGDEAEGLVAELEFCDGETPHRIPLYNAWAAQEGRPNFDEIKQITLEPRSYPFVHWRDYTTDRRVAMLHEIAAVVRAQGFHGTLATLTEVENSNRVLVGNMNLQRLRAGAPEWELVTYDSIYDRRVNRLATMDFCVQGPRALGYTVSYLTRGVITFGAAWQDIEDSLDEQWRMSLEDARDFQPDRLWFMGADARTDGMVCNVNKLPGWGYPDGRRARLALMEQIRRMGIRSIG